MKRPEGFEGPKNQPPAGRPGRPSKPTRPVSSPPVSPRDAARHPRQASGPREPRRDDAANPAPSFEAAQERARRKVERLEARRFTRNSRRRRVVRLGGFGVAALLALVLAVAVYSPLLALRSVRIEGTSQLSAVQVRAAVSDQLGTPLALLDYSRIRRQLANFTLIRSYVTETLPPSTLVIHVVERQAIGTIRDGAAFDQVDAAGVVLATVPTRGSLPLIDIGGGKPGGPAFESAVNVLLAMPADLTSSVTAISAASVDDVRLTLGSNSQQVSWGNDSQSELKARVLALALRQKHCRPPSVIDVSAPLALTCGPDPTATGQSGAKTPTGSASATPVTPSAPTPTP